jgi:hypothetical protein
MKQKERKSRWKTSQSRQRQMGRKTKVAICGLMAEVDAFSFVTELEH